MEEVDSDTLGRWLTYIQEAQQKGIKVPRTRTEMIKQDEDKVIDRPRRIVKIRKNI